MFWRIFFKRFGAFFQKTIINDKTKKPAAISAILDMYYLRNNHRLYINVKNAKNRNLLMDVGATLARINYVYIYFLRFFLVLIDKRCLVWHKITNILLFF
jgi:hypothetical protein